MFVRKNKNRSGSVSVQIISKNQGRIKIIKTVGVARDPNEIKSLSVKAKMLIPRISGQASLLPPSPVEVGIKHFVKELSGAQLKVVGPELVFGKIFDNIGFKEIEDKLFRHLVITRLVYPGSKLKTIDYLFRYQGVSLSVYTIYRFLDKLNNRYQKRVEEITFANTKKVLKGNISVVFYDLTTLYFEANDEDDLRKIGFSKDGKFHKPQIMLGFLVGEKGYPIGYDIFTGNTFEGHTLVPALQRFQQKFKLDKPIVVADSGLLSKNNLEDLAKRGYQYILGARIKNETKTVKEQILQLKLVDQEIGEIDKDDKLRLIISHSPRRARKDAYNRKRGLERLKKNLASGRLTKKHINNRGYNKYLKLKGKIYLEIDHDKFEADAQWDGLKGYFTNSNLSPKEVIENYTHLWQIERAFRISKTDLKIRPIFHRLKRRIEAHICIAFTAYTVYKELERILVKHQTPFSPRRAGELAQTIYELSYTMPESLKEEKQILRPSKDQQLLLEIIRRET